MEIFSIGYVLLATQNALLGVVAPSLRAVVVDVRKDIKWFYICFYYDGKVSEHLIDLWQCAATEASADLGPYCELEDRIEQIDYPRPIPIHGWYAYLRKEPNIVSPPYLESSKTVVAEINVFKDNVGDFFCPVSTKKMKTIWGVVDGAYIVPARPLDYPIEITPIAYALLAVQRAFLGKVTPELRAIIVDACGETHFVYIHCYYDGQLSQETMMLWESAIIETSAAMGSEYTLDAGIHHLNYPQPIPFRGRIAYSRYEPKSNSSDFSLWKKIDKI